MQFRRSVVVAAIFSGAQAEITSGSALAPIVTPQPRTTSRLTRPLMRSLSMQAAIRSYWPLLSRSVLIHLGSASHAAYCFAQRSFKHSKQSAYTTGPPPASPPSPAADELAPASLVIPPVPAVYFA